MTETVAVVDTAPLPGSTRPVEHIPAPVQTRTARELEQSGALDLSAFLVARFNAVHVNELQGNPSQPDVSYRGYTASPLLGTPQGISDYMDGVRLNQSFGDVVSWDLVPRSAVASVALVSGANPLFGLNTLGGALVIQTKNGREDAGTSFQSTVGLGDSTGRDVPRATGSASEWGISVQQSTFVAPGAPRLGWVGVRVAF